MTWDRAEGKAALTPLLTHWTYCSLALSLRCEKLCYVYGTASYLVTWDRAEGKAAVTPFVANALELQQSCPKPSILEVVGCLCDCITFSDLG